jgi:hypothetical protein
VLFPLRLRCQHCDRTIAIDLPVDAADFKAPCPLCHDRNEGFFGLEFTIGFRLLERAHEEYKTRKDFSMTIIFAAMALEAELSRLYLKWTNIDMTLKDKDPADEEIEESFRAFRSIKEKLERVAKLMIPAGLVAFIRGDAEIMSTLKGWKQVRSPETFSKDVETALFWKRNRILHTGYGKFSDEEARNAFSLARLVLWTLVRMDLNRRKELERYLAI